MNLDSLPWVPCQNRSPRGARIDLLVIHTNEGPEGPSSAEGLASYLQRAPSGAGYNVTGDENSAVRCAQDSEAVWGAGGVNQRAWHYCLTGWSAQSAAQWDDPASRAALVIAAELVRQAAQRLGVPMARITDPRPGNRGICGHGDVSRYYTASGGHTDPGGGFPWDHFMAMVTNAAPAGPSAEQIAAYFKILEELDMEHGMAKDAAVDPANPLNGITLDAWGGISPFGKVIGPKDGPYWPGNNVARRLVGVTWKDAADGKRTCSGYVLDLRGGLHAFGGAPRQGATPYWKGGLIQPIAEL